MWLVLDEGWEANLDRQRRGITVAPIVAPGMRRWKERLKPLLLIPATCLFAYMLYVVCSVCFCYSRLRRKEKRNLCHKC